MAMLLIMAMVSQNPEVKMRRPLNQEISGPASRERSMLSALSEALNSGGWKVRGKSHAGESPRPDLIVSRKGVKIAIELKVIAEGRTDRLIPLWSQAWLQAQHMAPKGHIPMAVVGAERIAPKAAEAVIDFIAQVAPKALAGVMDFEGMRRFRGPNLEGLSAEPVLLPRRSEQHRAVRGNLFSDLNQWMLKVLLAPNIPGHMLNAPRSQYRGASDLARAAGVSVMSSSRFIQELRSEGYLENASPYLRLVRIRHLLERWQAAVAAKPIEEQRWRVLIHRRTEEAVVRWLAQVGGCLALFASAREHGLGFVEGVPPYLYAPKSTVVSPDLSGFAPAGIGEAPDFIVRKASAPQSVFRGMVDGRRPASDILQVWLDVAAHATRGREQADLIWRKVLEPLCESERG